MIRLLCFLFIAFFLSLGPSASAQVKHKPAGALSKDAVKRLTASEDTLAMLGFLVVNDSLEKERFAACRALITTLVRTLKTENSFKYPFSRLKSVSIMAPPDSSFRIFTWQLFVNDSTYRYYGAIQLNSKDLQLFPLVDRSDEMDYPMPLHETFSAEKWYGALYYNLRQFETKQGPKYLLIGYDAFSFFEKRKVIDVLSFGADGKPQFGAAVFEHTTPPKGGPEMRLMLEYSSETSVRCNWDEQYGMVLFDHLIPWASPFGKGMTAVPDGSYDALQLEKGKWKYIDKVFNDSQEEAPTITPVLTSDKTLNVVGKSKKKEPKIKKTER